MNPNLSVKKKIKIEGGINPLFYGNFRTTGQELRKGI